MNPDSYNVGQPSYYMDHHHALPTPATTCNYATAQPSQEAYDYQQQQHPVYSNTNVYYNSANYACYAPVDSVYPASAPMPYLAGGGQPIYRADVDYHHQYATGPALGEWGAGEVQATSRPALAGVGRQRTPKKRQQRCKRDPNEPQKPVSAYALFFRDKQAAIKGENPNASFGEVSKIVAAMWDGLDALAKREYKHRTETAKKDYLKQRAAYRATSLSSPAKPTGADAFANYVKHSQVPTDSAGFPLAPVHGRCPSACASL